MGKRPERKTMSASNLMYRGVPREYINADLDEYPIDDQFRELFARYMDYMDEMYEDTINLILYGANGTGKSYLSSLVIKEAYKKRYSSFRVTLQGFIDLHFKRFDDSSKEKLHAINTCDFLVIDEVGKETFGEKMFNITTLEELMRERDTLGKPTIICTNLPLDGKDGLYKQYGNSIKDLIDGKFMKVEFIGDSNRSGVTKKKRGLNLLLGSEE